MKSNIKSLRSQMKIQEMSFMIIALVVFFIIVLLFYLAISLSGLKQRFDASTRAGNILLVSKIAESPEFSCADASSILCVDEDKILALKQNKAYTSFFQVDGLKIETLRLLNESQLECSLGNYPNCNIITIVSNKSNSVADSSFISLCRKEYKNGYTYNKCEPAKITIWTQKRT